MMTRIALALASHYWVARGTRRCRDGAHGVLLARLQLTVGLEARSGDARCHDEG